MWKLNVSVPEHFCLSLYARFILTLTENDLEFLNLGINQGHITSASAGQIDTEDKIYPTRFQCLLQVSELIKIAVFIRLYLNKRI